MEVQGKCAYIECPAGIDEVFDGTGCTHCSKVVHHFCSNIVYDGELSVRACSVECSAILRSGDETTSTHTPTPALKSSAASTAATKTPNNKKAPGKSKKKRKKFFFTKDADLMLLKEAQNLRPFAAAHGNKGKIYVEMAEKLGKKFEAKELSDRTVKERLLHLVDQFRTSDEAYRKKSGPAEDYDEIKQLLTDISMQMDNIKDTKAAKKTAAKKKADRLQSQGEILREKATKRRCQRKSSEGSGTGSSGASEDLADTASTGVPSDTEGGVGDVSAYTRKSSLKLAASANTGLAEYLGFQRQLRNEEMAKLEYMVQLKEGKMEKEEQRWSDDFTFRKEYAYKKELNWTEELEMRREEAAIRRSELEVRKEELKLFHQLLLKQYDHKQS